MYEEEQAILDQAIAAAPETSCVNLWNWNEAVALQARLNRFIKHDRKTMAEVYGSSDPRSNGSPYSRVLLSVTRPGMLVIQPVAVRLGPLPKSPPQFRVIPLDRWAEPEAPGPKVPDPEVPDPEAPGPTGPEVPLPKL